MNQHNKKKRKAFLGISFPKLEEHVKAAALNTGFSLFFNLLPFWAGILIISSFGNWSGWNVFYKDGEFYLYSCSLISSAYLIYHNNKVKVADLSSVFSILSLILIVVTSILYASLTTNNAPQVTSFIKWASIIAIALAIPLFYYSQIIHNKKSPDIGEQRRGEQETIANGLS
ncbi:MAG: hypothetical protein JJ862_03760 [Roseivirga sp.]|uniref:hypothetical protein n=1 Tax=Roseivirga sp. TaxID=1964215 RepID=UPI001B0BEF6D|nr:hypothetical protein [Roseivirga sp.]MBO6659880.1 hypothetical protein [Roseivirga sp.]MBO6907383.1 hypothetical protein [Roseivirga sp.]